MFYNFSCLSWEIILTHQLFDQCSKTHQTHLLNVVHNHMTGNTHPWAHYWADFRPNFPSLCASTECYYGKRCSTTFRLCVCYINFLFSMSATYWFHRASPAKSERSIPQAYTDRTMNLNKISIWLGLGYFVFLVSIVISPVWTELNAWHYHAAICSAASHMAFFFQKWSIAEGMAVM